MRRVEPSPPARLATRRSRLAVIQAEIVRSLLETAHPGLPVELLLLTSRGDRIPDRSLEALEGTGFFTADLEAALRSGQASLAVHSLKDLPTELGPGFTVAAVVERADPRDVLVSAHGGLDELPSGSLVGTDSSRRRAQLRAARPDLRFAPVRGNVPTRLNKLDRGEFDALVLAAAGLIRLGLSDRLRHPLDPSICLPAPGQGAIAVEAHGGEWTEIASAIDLPDRRAEVTAERAFLAALGGGCQSAAGALAVCRDGILEMDAGAFEGGAPVRVHVSGPAAAADDLGREAASLVRTEQGI